MKRFIGMLVVMSMFLLAIPFSASAAATEINTPDDYVFWLKGQDGSEKTLEQFSELSESEQVKFVEYINSPKINTELLDAMSKNEKVVLYGGDIVVEHKSATSDISMFAADYAVSQRAVATVLGVDLAQIRERVEYRVTGTPGNQKVEKILNGGGIVDHYWVPFGKMEVKDDQGYVSANGKRAVQRSTFTSSFVHPKFGLTMGTREFTIYGNVNGQLDDWILN